MAFGNGGAKRPPAPSVRERNGGVQNNFVPEEHRGLPEPLNPEDWGGPGVEKANPPIIMDKLHEHIIKNPVRDIALLAVALTYGEMSELEETIKTASEAVDQKIEVDLKLIMHRWAMDYLKKEVAND